MSPRVAAVISIASLLSSSKAEGDSGNIPFTFEVTRSGNLGTAATVQWSVTGSGANPAGEDFFGVLQNSNIIAFPSGTITFAPGETRKILTIEVLGDLQAEPDETFTVTLANPTGGQSLGISTAIGTIIRDGFLGIGSDRGVDDRVPATTGPLNAVVAIDADYSGTAFNGVGSGILIAGDFALTAGHVLADAGSGAVGSLITVSSKVPALTPRIVYGSTGGVAPSLTASTPMFSTVATGYNAVAAPFFPFNYIVTSAPADDIGLQQTNTALIKDASAVPLAIFVNPQSIKGFAINTAGYPATYSKAFELDNGRDDALLNDNTGRTLYSASGTVSKVVDEAGERARIYYSDTIDTQGGQSGSGVWISSLLGETKDYLVAIHNYGDNNTFANTGNVNSGSLITLRGYNLISDYMETQYGATAAAKAAALPVNAMVGTDPGLFAFIGFGANGSDYFPGTFRREKMTGLGGDDRFFGGGGDDELLGGDGVDQALFRSALPDYTITVTNGAAGDFVIDHTGGTRQDGKDTTSSVEFAVFEFLDADDNGTDDDGVVMLVPLQADPANPTKLKDGPMVKPTEKVLDSGGVDIGSFNAELPAWSFDGDVEYSLRIGATGLLFNVALIVDVSGSMTGSPLEQTKSALSSLIQSFRDRGLADNTQFAVVPFNSSASLLAPLTADQAESRIQGLSAGGGTSFGPALSQAQAFFAAQPRATNLAYFVSDGFGSGASDSLQSFANVQAFGLPGADTSGLNLIDTDNVTILNQPSDIITALNTTSIDRSTIDRIDVLLDGVVVDIVSPADLIDEGAGGFRYSGSIDKLDIQRTANNKVDFILLFNDGTPSVTLTSAVTTGQSEVTTQTNNGTTVVVVFSVDQAAYTPNIGTGQSLELYANDLANTINLPEGDSVVEALGGNDIIVATSTSSGVIDGGEGVDRIVIPLSQAGAGGLTRLGNIVNVGSSFSLLNVEFIDFADGRVATADFSTVPIASVSPTSLIVNEGGDTAARTATFSITLSEPTTTDLAIGLATIGGTADAADFTSPPASVTIAAGSQSASFDVVVLEDAEAEGTETIALRAVLPLGVQFQDGSAEALFGISIDDDDVQVSVSAVGPGTVFEGGTATPGIASILISRTGNLDGTLEIDYSVQGTGVSPVSAADFAAGQLPSGRITLGSGESTGVLALEMAGDNILEDDKSFTVGFVSQTPGVVSPDDLTFRLIDDDHPPTDPNFTSPQGPIDQPSAPPLGTSLVTSTEPPAKQLSPVPATTRPSRIRATDQIDVLTGTPLSDTFIFKGVQSTSTRRRVKFDTLVDFETQDRIVFRDFDERLIGSANPNSIDQLQGKAKKLSFKSINRVLGSEFKGQTIGALEIRGFDGTFLAVNGGRRKVEDGRAGFDRRDMLIWLEAYDLKASGPIMLI